MLEKLSKKSFRERKLRNTAASRGSELGVNFPVGNSGERLGAENGH